jgi:hypothetical protein
VKVGLQLMLALLLDLAVGEELRAQWTERPSDSELAAISERGRELAAYDQAVWHATDALQTANPKTAQGQRCLARFANGSWIVVFGSLNADKTRFSIGYEALQGSKPRAFSVKREELLREDSDFYLFAARAVETALADFGGTSRPYNAAILPTGDQQFHVYLYPAPLKANSYPLGGDVRYLISGDGKQILQKSVLHKTIIEVSAAKAKKGVASSHTHVLSDFPEDTDVLHVLQQDPPSPEMVATPHFVYEISADGTIRIKHGKKR